MGKSNDAEPNSTTCLVPLILTLMIFCIFQFFFLKNLVKKFH